MKLLRRPSLLLLLAACLGVATPSSAAAPDSDEYSAQAFLETTVVGVGMSSVMNLRSTFVGEAAVIIAGLSPGAFNLGTGLPILRVGPRYFFFSGSIAPNGTFDLPFDIGPLFPPGNAIFAQGFVVTVGGQTVGSNTLRLVPNGSPSTWADGTGDLPRETSLFGGGDVDWADLDRNGYVDIVVANVGDGAHTSLLMNSESGLTDEALTRLPAEAQITSICVEMADADGDGDVDLFIGGGPNASEPQPNLFLTNDGAGQFELERSFPIGSGYAVDAEFGDVDGDGDLDLFLVSGTDPDHLSDDPGPTTLYEQTGGSFVEDPVFSALPGNDPLIVDGDVSLGDVDLDGDLDVFVARAGPQGGGAQNQIYFNDGLGAFEDETGFSLPQIEDSSFEADFLDLNQDGLLDIFVANSLDVGPSVNMIVNLDAPSPTDPVQFIDGQAVFLGPFPPSTNIRLGCDVADVDGDGDQDIGVGVHHLFGSLGAEGEAFLLLNQGGVQGGLTGSFQVDAGFGTFGNVFVAGDIAFGDVDNDGDADCYVTSNGDLLMQNPPQDVLLINQR